MLKTRIIPILLLNDGGLVKTVKFSKDKYIGDPINAVKIFNQKEVDEFAYPYGLFSDEIVIEAEKLGYKYQLGTENNKIDSYTNHPVIKGRKGIYQCDSWGNQLI